MKTNQTSINTYILVISIIAMLFIKDLNITEIISFNNKKVGQLNNIEKNIELELIKTELEELNLLVETEKINYKNFISINEKIKKLKNRNKIFLEEVDKETTNEKDNLSNIVYLEKVENKIINLSKYKKLQEEIYIDLVNLDRKVENYKNQILNVFFKYLILMFFLYIIYKILNYIKEIEKNKEDKEEELKNIELQIYKTNLKRFLIIVYLLMIVVSLSIDNMTYLITFVSAISIFLAFGLREQLSDLMMFFYMNSKYSALTVGDEFKILEDGFNMGKFKLVKVNFLSSTIYNSRTNEYINIKNVELFKKNKKNIVMEDMYNLSLEYVLPIQCNLKELDKKIIKKIKELNLNTNLYENKYGKINKHIIEIRNKYGMTPYLADEKIEIKFKSNDINSIKLIISFTILSTKSESQLENFFYLELLEYIKQENKEIFQKIINLEK